MAKKKQTAKRKKAPEPPNSKSIVEHRRIPADIRSLSLPRFDRYQALSLAILFLLGFAIYSNNFNAPFVFDDTAVIQRNVFIRMEELSGKNIIQAAVGYAKNRPVSMLSFAFNYYFGRYDTWGYHLVNNFIHIITGILLFFLVQLTLVLVNLQDTDKLKFNPITITTLSFFTALLWLVNPAQTQSVTYIVQRMSSMGAMFFILSLLLYARGRIRLMKLQQENEAGFGPHYFWFAGCLVAGLLALGSKESTAMLPVFIFLFEWYFFQDLAFSWFKRQFKYLAAIVIVFGLVAGLYLGFDPLEKFNTLRDFAFKEFTIGERLLTQTRVVVYYLSLIFYPNPSRLNLDYDFPLSYSLFNPFTTFVCLFLIIVMIGLGLFLAKKQRLISFGIFWFFGNLAIESSVIPLALIFEHRIYLPSMFVFLVIVLLVQRTVRPAWLPAVIACAVVAVWAFWTYERNKVWQDDLTLWADCILKSPNKARPYINHGKLLIKRDQYDEALSNFRKAIQLCPNCIESHYNLGVLYEKQGKESKSIEYYHKALQIDPNYIMAHNNLGVVLLHQNRTEEAISHFKKALEIDSNMAAPHVNLGLALIKLDNLTDAVDHFNQALQISSNLPKAQFHLGAALVKQGRTAQGLHHIRRSLEIDPDYAEAHNNIGGHLLQEGKIDEALGHFEAALKTNPELAEAHNNIGIILIHKGKVSEAVFHLQEALSINPEFELARDNLRRAMAIQQANLEAEVIRVQSELETAPDDPILSCVMGNLYLGKGDLNNAISWFEKATTLQPDFPQALNNLAMAYNFTGKHGQALEIIQRLIELQPDNAANYYNVAVLYALQNNKAESLDWLKQAVAKGYDNWELIKMDRDLENIRDTEGYRELIEGH